MSPTWPFWAPSDENGIEAALDLAGLGRGDRFVDLGCGDGRVLVAAARRGARVLGIEAERDLVERARRALDEAGLADRGAVVRADLLAATFEAEVVYAYLSPAMLQRLRSRLEAIPGDDVRFLSVGFHVPGAVAAELGETAWLYRMPFQLVGPQDEIGWGAGGTVFSTTGGRQVLLPLRVVHPGGEVHARLTGELADSADLLVGTDRAAPGEIVAVDLRWRPNGSGTAPGALCIDGLKPYPLIGFVADSLELFDIDAHMWPHVSDAAATTSGGFAEVFAAAGAHAD